MASWDERWARVEIAETLVGRGVAHARRRARPIRGRVDRLLHPRTVERARRKGANGERVTGDWLDRLPEGWFVFHDVPVGARGANLDHLVIGPGGVFTVNTKHLTGSIRVNPRTITNDGHRTSFLPKATAEARRAAERLSTAVGRAVEVRAVLAILADEWDIVKEPTDVLVRGPRGAKNLMLSQPEALTRREATELAAAAAKPSTWATATPPTGKPAPVRT
jgi:Nuclease-related domain